MRTLRWFGGAFGCLAASVMALGVFSPVPAVAHSKKHLLVVTYTTGFRHSSITVAEPIVKEIADRSGKFDVDYARTGDEVKTKMSPEGLRHYDGVFFCQTTGDIGIPERDAFLAWVRAGHGVIGTHSATDTYHNWQGYKDLIGAEFLTHGRQVKVNVNVEDPNFPSVKMLPKSMQHGFQVFDEIYEFRPESVSRSRTHVILSMSQHPQTGAAGDYWVSWSRCEGKGRVFYTSLGHREDVWQQPWYQNSLQGGIEWALGLRKGSCKPSAER